MVLQRIRTLPRPWLKKDRLIVLISGLFFVLAGGRYAWLIAGPGAWGPRFACAEPDVNIGNVPVAQTVEHEFVVSNVGRRPMKLLKAAPGCTSCLSVQVSDYEIAPGKSAKIKAVLRPGRLPVGKFEQRVWVETNSTNVPRITLFMRGYSLADGKAIPIPPYVIKRPVVVTGLKEAVDKLRVTEPVGLSVLLHAMHAFGPKMPVVVSTEPMETAAAQDLILNHALATRYFKEAPLHRTRYGVRCRLIARRNADLQPEGVVHAYQLLAVLGMNGVPLGAKLSTADGEGHVMDLLADALANFSPAQDEIEWATVAFAIYVAPQREWKDKFGKTITFDELAQRLLKTRFDSPGLACAGIHLLQALTVLFVVDQQAPILSKDIRLAVRKHLQEQAKLAADHQQSSGALSHVWYLGDTGTSDGGGVLKGIAKQRLDVVATGHHLEWLVLLPQDMRPGDDVFARAGRWLFEQLQAASREEINEQYCPYSHAANMAQRLCKSPEALSRKTP